MNLKKEVGKRALDYHKAGFHCAEAVSKAVVEIHDQGICRDIPKVATAFGGGVGRTHQDICGALTGGSLLWDVFWVGMCPAPIGQMPMSRQQS